jgi:osmotically-inducible protein OsmY
MRFMLIIGAVAASAAGFAQPADFQNLDRNADGYLSRAEIAAVPEIARRFAHFDTDKDRRLSRREYAAAREEDERRAVVDAALTARVKQALNGVHGIPSTAISVETYEGEVQLSGFVPAADLASRAGRITAGVSGVRMVHNNLVVRQK